MEGSRGQVKGYTETFRWSTIKATDLVVETVLCLKDNNKIK
jgi:hypothetical protein